MRGLTFTFLSAVAAIGMVIATPQANAQIGVQVGPAPDCPYGYYEVAPYNCAPAGYYGPEWFNDGGFVGVGPWYHGRDDFHGWVDNHYHPDHGYRGDYPHRGDRADPGRRANRNNFHGNEMHDGHGHVVENRH